MVYFPLNIEKAIQASATLLRGEKDRRMSRMRLLKLLYIADRESLKRAGRSIVGSAVVAMKNGPVHSEIYDLVKGEHIEEPKWSQFFQNDGICVQLRQDPGVAALSRFDISVLNDVPTNASLRRRMRDHVYVAAAERFLAKWHQIRRSLM